MKPTQFDIVTMGRSSVDLYSQQIGTKLENADTFKKAVGGCPSNIAIGCARLGLKSAIITRVGDEPFGRFIIDQLAQYGVDTRGIKIDPERLSALAILSIRNQENFPLIFYRENCADMALTTGDLDKNLLLDTKSLLVTGTHFSQPNTAQAQLKAAEIVKTSNGQVIFDIDFRPNLWGLAGHNEGELRFISNEFVTSTLKSILPLCNVIVGTEEEISIAGGHSNTIESLKTIRAQTEALLIVKRGPLGSVAFSGSIPENLELGESGRSFKVNVLNVLGAGDAFLSGFLSGYLTQQPIEECLSLGNAAGALVVTRLMCSSEIPGKEELQRFMAEGFSTEMAGQDSELKHFHWISNRFKNSHDILVLAIDHRSQLETIAAGADRPFSDISVFKSLALSAALIASKEQPGVGVLLDSTYGSDSLLAASENNLWVGRPVEEPGSRPLKFEGDGDIGSQLISWPKDQTIKCLCYYRADDPDDLREQQEKELLRIFDASRRVERELMLEIICPENSAEKGSAELMSLTRLYEIGIKPDWWKLQAKQGSEYWSKLQSLIETKDPHCKGIIMLGLDTPFLEIEIALKEAARHSGVTGFAIGRTIFGDSARSWFGRKISNEDAISEMSDKFLTLIALWFEARKTQSIEPKTSENFAPY